VDFGAKNQYYQPAIIELSPEMCQKKAPSREKRGLNLKEERIVCVYTSEDLPWFRRFAEFPQAGLEGFEQSGLPLEARSSSPAGS